MQIPRLRHTREQTVFYTRTRLHALALMPYDTLGRLPRDAASAPHDRLDARLEEDLVRLVSACGGRRECSQFRGAGRCLLKWGGGRRCERGFIDGVRVVNWIDHAPGDYLSDDLHGSVVL